MAGISSALWPEQERGQVLLNLMGIAGRIYVYRQKNGSHTG